MNNLFWASPEAIGKMTLTQLLCLTEERAPTDRRNRTAEEHDAALAKQAEFDEGWRD